MKTEDNREYKMKIKKMDILKDLKKRCKETSIMLSEPLWKHTYIQVGGVADVFIEPKNIEEVLKIIQYSYERKIPLTILGYGTNVIIKDNGIRGIVINLNHFKQITVHGHEITAGSGASIIDVSESSSSTSFIRIRICLRNTWEYRWSINDECRCLRW